MTEKNVNEGSPVGLLLSALIILLVAAGLSFLVGGQRGAGEASQVAQDELEYITNSLGMQFVRLPAGRFTMGDEGLGYGPEREVGVGAFYMGVHEVTQAQWEAVMGYNPSHFQDPRRPVDSVPWLDVQIFLEQLNVLEGTNRYRLPSESEWEYAARAGSESRFFFGEDASLLRRFAWFGANQNRGTRAVGSLQPSPWGLYDIYGNVWEWVQDCWHESYLGAPSDSRSWGGMECQQAGLRGGGWNNKADNMDSVARGSYGVRFGDVSNGFRVVLSERR